MSAIEHPQIDPSEQFTSDTLFTREMAEEAIEVLTLYGHRLNTIENGYEVTRFVTERVDIDGCLADGNAKALRLTRVSQLATAGSPAEVPHLDQNEVIEVNPTKEPTFFVVGFELGKLAVAEDAEVDAYDITDSDFSWQTYALFVSHVANGEVDILSGQTGEELNTEDALQVMSSLQFVHRSLRFVRYEEIVLEGEDPIETVITPHDDVQSDKFADVFSTDDVLMQNYTQHDCHPACTAVHQQTMFN